MSQSSAPSFVCCIRRARTLKPTARMASVGKTQLHTAAATESEEYIVGKAREESS